MATCRELGCNREATYTVVVNEPRRGYAEDPACREHAEKASGRVCVRDLRIKEGENECVQKVFTRRKNLRPFGPPRNI